MDTLPISKDTKKGIMAVIVGMMVIVIAILTSIIFQFSLVANLVMSWLLTTAYALFAFFLIDPKITLNPTRVVEKPVIREVLQIVEKPIVKEIQIPIENRIIEVVEKPVIVEKEVLREVPVEVEKRIVKYVERKHRKLNIPKYAYIGSTQTHTYHRRTCKFSKMLKNKYKLHSNTKALFKRKHYKACKTCIKKK